MRKQITESIISKNFAKKSREGSCSPSSTSISTDLKHSVQSFFCFHSYMLRNMDLVFHILKTVKDGLESDFFHIIAKSLL